MFLELKLRFRILTPMFLGGADQNAELRAPSIKGALRFWYRAIDPEFSVRPYSGPKAGEQRKGPSNEEQLFGGVSAGAGQSAVLLHLNGPRPEKTPLVSWDSFGARDFQEGGGKFGKNGLVYLGYPFQMRPGPGSNRARNAIAPNTELVVRCFIPRPISQRLRRGLLASWWLLGRLGALGSRARRGFGSLSLCSWQIEGEESARADWRADMDQLLVKDKMSDVEWLESLLQGTDIFGNWFGVFPEDARTSQHPHIGSFCRWVMGARAFSRWQPALNDAGRKLQDFRLRRGPDYQNVKNHILWRQGRGGAPIRRAPERAVFGLPLIVRYSSLSFPKNSETFAPLEKEGGVGRHGSLLFIKLVECSSGLHPFFLRLDGALPGFSPRISWRGGRQSLEAPETNLMDEFMNQL